MKLHDCDICGSSENWPIWVAARLIAQEQMPPVICQNCGFVYVRERRSSAEIAEDWKLIYAEGLYDPTWPGVKARLYYVAEWIGQNIGVKRRRILDIGGGTGTFAGFCRDLYDAPVTILDPTADHRQFETVTKTVEAFEPSIQYDIVTILWTLENCGDCNAMIAKARECLKPDGHLVVATGSRILVPFRKPMSMYFSTEPQDLHAFRWSKRSLGALLRKHELVPVFNDYEQNDVLLAHAIKKDGSCGGLWDDSAAVENHFIDWYRSFP